MRIRFPGKGGVLFFLVIFLNSISANGQLGYTFSTTTATFANNTGGTNIYSSANWDSYVSSAQNIGFTFNMGCNSYTQFKLSTNGWMALGTAPITGNSGLNSMTINALTTTGLGPIIAPLWDDLNTTAPNSRVGHVLTGTAPNRVLTIEWLYMKWSAAATGDRISFQVKLYETTNVIEFIYRQETGTVSSASASIGLSGGNSSTDFYSLDGTGASPNCVYGTETNTLNVKPATGQVYRFTPAAMVYSSTTTTQPNTSTAPKCGLNQEIAALNVVTTGGCENALTVSQIQFSMAGSTIAGTNTNDVIRIRIYYTGAYSTFSPINEFVSGGIAPTTGTITATGTQILAPGPNYFWIAYDVNGISATNGNLLDAECTQVTVAGISRTPTTTAPAGSRTIGNCTVSPGGVNSSLAFWIKSNAGTSTTTNAATVATWNDQSGYARNATSPSGLQSPIYYDNSTNNINYYPVVDFDDASQSATNGDYMDITSNGILTSGNNIYTVYAVIKPGGNNLTTPGKFLFAGASGMLTFNAFDIRSGYSMNDSWNNNDLIVANQWTTNYPTLASFNYSNSLREMFISGSSIGTLSSNSRSSSNINSALGVQRSAGTLIEFYDGNIAEIITYPYTTHAQDTRYRVESYLGMKYGMTISHNYISSLGAVVWNRSTNASYNNNIIALARDDNSALVQKQAKTTSTTTDMLGLYIGPSKQTNQANNSGSFTAGDQSYFVTGNNADPYIYAWSTPEKPAGIVNRLRREWLSQQTNFTNTDLKIEFDFNVIKPGYSALFAGDIRLLVDADGDFTNATILGSPDISVAVASGIVTITVPATNFVTTPYFTMASVANTTPLPVLFTGLSGVCDKESIRINWTAIADDDRDYYVERSANGLDFKTVYLTASVLNISYYTWKDLDPLAGQSYYRIRSMDRDGKTSYSTIITIRDCRPDESYVSVNSVGRSTLNLRLMDKSLVEIDFYDQNGKSIKLPFVTGKKQFAAGSYQLHLNTSGFAKGIYMLLVTINGKQVMHKVMN